MKTPTIDAGKILAAERRLRLLEEKDELLAKLAAIRELRRKIQGIK